MVVGGGMAVEERVYCCPYRLACVCRMTSCKVRLVSQGADQAAMRGIDARAAFAQTLKTHLHVGWAGPYHALVLGCQLCDASCNVLCEQSGRNAHEQ